MELCDLKELGFETAAKAVEEKIEQQRKLHAAYQNFEFITPEDWDRFNQELMETTRKETRGQISYRQLASIAVKDYKEVPPADVLEKMKAAVKFNCFDAFEIAKIEERVEVKDPILFGRINGCGDRFFIAQWDDDITMEMIKAGRKEL